jgi:hypothetical protein
MPKSDAPYSRVFLILPHDYPGVSYSQVCITSLKSKVNGAHQCQEHFHTSLSQYKGN